MKCPKCNGIGWILYLKDAPIPPYKEGQKLEWGLRCGCKDEPKKSR